MQDNQNPLKAMPVWTAAFPGVPYGGAIAGNYEQITSLSGAKQLTGLTGANTAMVMPEGGNGRWKCQGVALKPTASEGMPLWGTATYFFPRTMWANLWFIDQSTGLILNVTYF